ncbi:MAG: hypothetical protein JGK17_23330 [Microcoleus sp. PH2017_10_PVI_O_A]|uniref:hypothetical protein n=1 Tax=unclassified Microcoleus TaxID=2642155 RepID=UPI001E02FBFE|nr:MULTISPECIES: hypothetical protein [unclassified Microcoleus]MCC3408463.1 hypothetical protein [Microcoleus sp. PH2017_10_PVI_O_A]MCC3462536.1 hypothetical protein [Microcoleus sp. PH2017_11_PCY_U_A]MCC3480970.1 hypothetical protein [Microcoleus sp. PH2017_12_PCY_D_A]MCC3530395.1 hypothetical protein [Microcoleus sp. PH2017_21_RUC_O_A]MCC3542705.1 hypothetical protein [Microcoleus sp. PH2017_22_RUC_O_B]
MASIPCKKAVTSSCCNALSKTVLTLTRRGSSQSAYQGALWFTMNTLRAHSQDLLFSIDNRHGSTPYNQLIP